jgi:hypothetical protein
MRPSPRVALVLAACLIMGHAAAENAHPGAKSDDMLADALAVVRINDPRWLDREITKFAATLGIDPAPMRGQMARLLFRCQGVEGIDLTRPALVAWRPGKAPLVAVIPLSNRRQFLDSFGVSLGDDAPLIRIGEREGTVLYSQNTNDGLVEYRLLVSDQAAYLARSTEECRALSEHFSPPALGDAPLVFTANATFLSSIDSDPLALLPESVNPALRAQAHGLGAVLWHELVGQLAQVAIEVRGEGDNGIHVVSSLRSLPDSPLAVWVGNQRNQPGHLLPFVRTPTTFLTLSGSILWQGQGERLGQIVGAAIKGRYGASWTASVDELWHGIWAIADRAGPFATGVDLEFQGGTAIAEGRYLADQQRAPELVTVLNSFIQTLSGAAGEAVSAATATGFHQSVAPFGDAAGGSVGQLAVLANEHQVVGVLSTSHDPVQVAGDIITRSATVQPPEGAPAIAAIGINFTPLLRALVQMAGGAAQPILPMAETVVSIKAMPLGAIAVDTVLPAQSIAQLFRDSGILLPAGK